MINLRQRFSILLLYALISLGTYKAVQLLVLNYLSLSQVSLLLPGEENIPFVPVFALVYLWVYVLPAWLFLSLERKGRLIKTFVIFLIALLIHLFFFMAMPVAYPLRPEIAADASFYHSILYFTFALDAPINTFPSMHVSFSFLSYYFMRRYKPEHARFFLIASIAISFSTVFIKQHFILDVVSGYFIAWLLNETLIVKNLKSVFSSEQQN